LAHDKKPSYSPSIFANDRDARYIYNFENINKNGSDNIIDHDIHLKGSPMSGHSSPSTNQHLLGVPNISSPKSQVASSRSSMQELVIDDR